MYVCVSAGRCGATGIARLQGRLPWLGSPRTRVTPLAPNWREEDLAIFWGISESSRSSWALHEGDLEALGEVFKSMT
jgi:hypothetical protein